MFSIIVSEASQAIEKTDLGQISLFLALILCLFFVLGFAQRLHLMLQQRKTQRTAWRSFANLAKIRGLDPAEIKVLTLVTKRANIKRPSQVLASVHVFDSCVSRFQKREELSSAENDNLESARKKLVSTVNIHSKYEERRQLARVGAQFPVQAHFIPRTWVQEQARDEEIDDQRQLQKLIEVMIGEVAPTNGQIVDIGAGGICLHTHTKPKFKANDFVTITGTTEPCKIDLSSLIGQIVAFEKHSDRDGFNLHLSFLPYGRELKREIIKLVYENEKN